MKNIIKSFSYILIVLVFFAMTTTTQAAGLITTIVIQNLLKTPVKLNGNAQLLGVAKPTTPLTINPGTTIYTVTSPYSDIASIHFSYTANITKTCRFDTSFTRTPTYLGSWIPHWTDNATSTGSSYVGCKAKITASNLTSYSYTVQFTIQ